MAEDIAARLPETEGTTNAYMFNRHSFKAMVMRYALYNERYDIAARLAKEIMDSKIYQLHPVYSDLFNYKADKTNKEFILKFDMESHNNSATASFQHLAPHFRTGNGAILPGSDQITGRYLLDTARQTYRQMPFAYQTGV